MKLIVTHHAVERFLKRIDGSLPGPEAARALLEEAAENATPTKQRTPLGHPIWRSPIRGCLFVVKHDHAQRIHVLVTVLREDELNEAVIPRCESVEDVAYRIDSDPSRVTPHQGPDAAQSRVSAEQRVRTKHYEALLEAMRATVPYLFTRAASGDAEARAALERIEAIDCTALVRALSDAWRD